MNTEAIVTMNSHIWNDVTALSVLTFCCVDVWDLSWRHFVLFLHYAAQNTSSFPLLSLFSPLGLHKAISANEPSYSPSSNKKLMKGGEMLNRAYEQHNYCWPGSSGPAALPCPFVNQNLWPSQPSASSAASSAASSTQHSAQRCGSAKRSHTMIVSVGNGSMCSLTPWEYAVSLKITAKQCLTNECRWIVMLTGALNLACPAVLGGCRRNDTKYMNTPSFFRTPN